MPFTGTIFKWRISQITLISATKLKTSTMSPPCLIIQTRASKITLIKLWIVFPQLLRFSRGRTITVGIKSIPSRLGTIKIKFNKLMQANKAFISKGTMPALHSFPEYKKTIMIETFKMLGGIICPVPVIIQTKTGLLEMLASKLLMLISSKLQGTTSSLMCN